MSATGAWMTNFDLFRVDIALVHETKNDTRVRAANCLWNAYNHSAWHFWPNVTRDYYAAHAYVRTTHAECATACLGTPGCTGIEIPLSERYCAFWLDGRQGRMGRW